MDVQCERCKTEYEFDDALVSARGTTVRCTQCQHEFKVRRASAGEVAADRWVVQTGQGHQLTFLTLRELQRAILAKQVARHDMLVLGDGGRPLGSIAELELFFDGRASSRPPPSNGDRAPSAPPGPPPRRTQSFGAPLEPLGAAERSPGSAVRVGSANNGGSATPPLAQPPPLTTQAALEAPPNPSRDLSSALPPPTVPVRQWGVPSTDSDAGDLPASSPSPFGDEPFDVPSRRRVGGWVVAFVLLMAVGIVGWVVAKPYLVARRAGEASPLDARAQGFLRDGEVALAEGDLEAAQQDLDKASALAEHDARVLLDEARVAAARADAPWLKLRLLPGDAVDEARATRAQLDERVARARRAADEAISAAPDDPAAFRAKIDALRLSGERDAARSYVSKLGAISSQPETSYVLAALDLAEPEPFWTTVIDRLRQVTAGETNPGRARAALVYALAKFGDAAGARAELAKLDALTRPHPCLPQLHALLDKAFPKAPPERSAAPIAAHGESSASPPPPTAAAPGAAATVSTESISNDPSSALQAAAQAIRKGEFGRARRIYEALIARNASDSEALAGIGDVARSQGDSRGAIGAYKRALAVNPSYLPALLGVADTEWAAGDRASAQLAYHDVVDRFPEGTYPSYVKARAEPGSPTSAAVQTVPPAASGNKPSDPGDGI